MTRRRIGLPLKRDPLMEEQTLRVRCPWCDARVGAPCRRSYSGEPCASHGRRYDAAWEAGLFDRPLV